MQRSKCDDDDDDEDDDDDDDDIFFFPTRMQERDLQSVCRRALLLTVCMVSLWGQLTGASSHRSHIGRQLRGRMCVSIIRCTCGS